MMALPDVPDISLRGAPSGEVYVFADGKFLGTLFWREGEFCVALSVLAVKTIGKPEGQ